MTDDELRQLVQGVALLAMAFGIIGGWIGAGLVTFVSWVFEALERRADRSTRIVNARWRAHWNKAMREAREAGYTGRRAIVYACHTMKTRRQAIRELEAS